MPFVSFFLPLDCTSRSTTGILASKPRLSEFTPGPSTTPALQFVPRTPHSSCSYSNYSSCPQIELPACLPKAYSSYNIPLACQGSPSVPSPQDSMWLIPNLVTAQRPSEVCPQNSSWPKPAPITTRAGPAKVALVRLAPGIPHGPQLFQFQLQPACQSGPGEACPQFPCDT